MKHIAGLLIISLGISGCISRESVSGAATVTSLLLAVPLVPFAETYHVINDSKGKAREKSEQLRQQFDPVYQQRIAIIDERDPNNDAIERFQQGTVAFLPNIRGISIFNGLLSQVSNESGEANQAVLDGDEFLTSLQALLANDPLHDSEYIIHYNSSVYDCFFAKSFIYKLKFNQQMSALSGRYELSDYLKARYEGVC